MVMHYAEQQTSNTGNFKAICGQTVKSYERTPHKLINFITCKKCLAKLKQDSDKSCNQDEGFLSL